MQPSQLAELFQRMVRLIQQDMVAACNQYEVDKSDFEVLRFISTTDGVPSLHIARHFSVHPSTTSRAVQRLKNANLVVNRPGLGRDNRHLALAATVRGSEIVQSIEQSSRNRLARALQHVDAAEVQVLHNLLQRILDEASAPSRPDELNELQSKKV